MTKKYKLTKRTKLLDGHILHRIQALKNFGDVKKGDLGGWIEKEGNLSHNGPLRGVADIPHSRVIKKRKNKKPAGYILPDGSGCFKMTIPTKRHKTMKKTKEIIISAFALPTGQIVILTNKGKLYCQEFIYTPSTTFYTTSYSGCWTTKWFEIKNPIDNKDLLRDNKKDVK